jgi:hypothetical protein
VIILEHIAEVEAAEADLGADVVVEIHRAVEVEVEVVRLVALIDA